MTTIGSVSALPPAPIRPVPKVARSVEPEEVLAAVEVESPEAEEKQSGVIRNLLAGHFKGVAALRLQINFADQLGPIQATATAQLAAEATGSFVSDATTAIEEFLANPDLTDPQHAAVTELADGFLAEVSAIEGTVSSSTGAYTEQLDALRAGLASALAAPAPAPIIADVDPEAPVEPTEPTVDSSSLLEDAEALMDVLDEQLAAAVESVSASPSLMSTVSGPSGKGAAYTKFMAIYQGMSEPMASDPGEPGPTVSVDVAV